MIRGTRRPGGAGRTRGGRSGGKSGKGGGGGTSKVGFWAEVFGCGVIAFGSLLMLGSGVAGLALALVIR
jgi:hypothetical protein